jgi:hypothetical protein
MFLGRSPPPGFPTRGYVVGVLFAKPKRRPRAAAQHSIAAGECLAHFSPSTGKEGNPSRGETGGGRQKIYYSRRIKGEKIHGLLIKLTLRYCGTKRSCLNRNTQNWHPQAVPLNEVKGLKSRFFAALTMTSLKGYFVKCMNVMRSDLGTLSFSQTVLPHVHPALAPSRVRSSEASLQWQCKE